MPCVGILGNKYTLNPYDPCTTNFEIYLMREKRQAPQATAQYFLDAKRRGLTIEPGSVLHSDNDTHRYGDPPILHGTHRNAHLRAHAKRRAERMSRSCMTR